MQKLGWGLLVVGVSGLLSAFLWVSTVAVPSCQRAVENSYFPREMKQLVKLVDSLIASVSAGNNEKPSEGLEFSAAKASPVPYSTAETVQDRVAGSGEELTRALTPLQELAHQWALIVCGLVVVAGSLLAFVARKKTNVPPWHVFVTTPGSLIRLERPCLTCGGFTPPTRRS